LPLYGWRIIFFVLAGLFALTMLGIAWKVPNERATSSTVGHRSLIASYKPIFASPYFRRIAFIGFVNYGVLVAVQTLWAGPWLTEVAGYSANEAAQGLFAVNLTMLFVFWFWGMANPRLHNLGLSPERLMVWGLPLGAVSLAMIAWLGPRAGWEAFAVFCALSSVLAVTHPAVGMAFPPHEAGRAISAFNLLLFLGVFCTQWSVGAGIDFLKASHWSITEAYRTMFTLLAVACGLSYIWFALGQRSAKRTIATAT
jgi:Major Facilitator Superfamily